MGFWIYMLICNLLIPISTIILGIYFVKKGCYTPNGIFGYRTNMSTKNSQTWFFAHKYIGKLWIIIGIVILPLSIISLLFVIGKDSNTVGTVGGIICIIQIVLMILPIFPTEKQLNRYFDKNGYPK